MQSARSQALEDNQVRVSRDELNKEYLEQLAEHFNQGQNNTLTDGAVFYRLSKILPSSTPIFLSNSFPVRDQALFAPMWSVDNLLISQRGAAGIDGISSTALGVSLSCQLPTAVITGDIAFLYDINALLSARLITKPLIIFVINNGGGNIFSSLPIKEAAPDSMDWFITPQQVSIEHLARSYGLNYSKIVNSNQLWDNDWAEKVKELLKIHTLIHSSTIQAEDDKFKKNDKVILTGFRVGEMYFGGFSQYAKVNSNFLVKKPKGITSRQAMMLGTAGMTAIQCAFTTKQTREVLLLGEKVNDVIVTGASGGVGSIAVLSLIHI